MRHGVPGAWRSIASVTPLRLHRREPRRRRAAEDDRKSAGLPGPRRSASAIGSMPLPSISATIDEVAVDARMAVPIVPRWRGSRRTYPG